MVEQASHFSESNLPRISPDDRQRDVVRAISIEGMSAREAADRFSISEGAVRVALHRGLSALAVSCRDLDQ